MIKSKARITPDGIASFNKFLPYWKEIETKGAFSGFATRLKQWIYLTLRLNIITKTRSLRAEELYHLQHFVWVAFHRFLNCESRRYFGTLQNVYPKLWEECLDFSEGSYRCMEQHSLYSSGQFFLSPSHNNRWDEKLSLLDRQMAGALRKWLYFYNSLTSCQSLGLMHSVSQQSNLCVWKHDQI